MMEADHGCVVAPDTHGVSDRDRAYDHILFIDTPIANTISQIRPFYDDGVFDSARTPVYLRSRMTLVAQMALGPSSLHPARLLSARQVRRLPVRKGGVVFYPFNSQSNMNRVADRSVHHVLILHGESNKAASFRPAARLYDYVTIAGPLARHRYLKNAIFSAAELDGGRAIMMGDTFVQSLKWARQANGGEEAAVLYCPTWEGYGGEANNYSSIVSGDGFRRACDAARALGSQRIMVKPHPYLGTLRPRMIVEFLRGLRGLRAAGMDVRVALSGANPALRAAVRLGFGKHNRLDETVVHPVHLALVDNSGMEAVFLKQRLPHMVLLRSMPPFDPLQEVYSQKALLPENKGEARMYAYLDNQSELDSEHRKLVFGWQTPELATMQNAERIDWLTRYVQDNKYWKHCSEMA